MKSRSYKLSTNEDWVEESWTVDCVCGVNFDDGEEMVNCDDCGVWVHTRCSRYVKSEKSFACDKCKNRKTRNDSEETEVAQLLVELPTKTLRMGNPTSYGPPKLPSASTLAPAYIRPCRLWTDIPIKERVHMQGIPGVGDDPSMFSGVSSVFGPQLWKCAGYVPKKFSFPYKEFPYWEEVEEDVHKKNGAVCQHRADNTIGVLVSSNSQIPSDLPEDLETKNGEVEHDKLKTAELATKLDCTVSEVSKPYLGVRKDQLLLQSSHFQCGKRKENFEMIKDRSGKKKARTMENHGEFKKKIIHFLGPASTNSSDVKKLQSHEERGHAAQKDDPQGSSKNCLKEQSLDASTSHSTIKEITKEGQSGSPIPEKLEDLSKTILNAASLLEHRDSRGISAEVQVAGNSDANTSKFEGRLPTVVRINSNKLEIDSKDGMIDHTKVQVGINKGLQDNCELNVQPSPVIYPNSKTRGIQTQSEEIYADCPINSARVNDTGFTALKSCPKAEDVSRGFKMENCHRDVADDVSPVAQHQPRLDKGGSENYLGAKNCSKEYEWKISDEPLKSNGSVPGPSLANGESELVASVGNSSSISAAVSPNSSAFGSCISASANYEDTNVKLNKISESNVCSYIDYGNTAVTEVVKGEGSPERPKISLTKHKSLHGSVTKSTQTKKVFHSANSKRTFTDSREPINRSANTLSPVPPLSASAQPANASVLQPEITSDVVKNASSLQSETASSLTKKVNGSVLLQKGEKINQPVPQMSSKVNTSLTHVATSSYSPAILSDEELALLLHQELNSSPRVPRVPRMRHAGSLPQLTSPTASSMMKRTSSAGGKEHGLALRRRDKEFPKDNSHGLRDGGDETEKTEWNPVSEHGGQDSGWTLRLARDAGNGSAKGVLCMKRSSAAASSATTSSSPVEASEHSSAINRSRNPSADDNMVVSCSAPRTLPGLIAEIMSKGQRMTYEELCNAVLPHWPNLRKHNGERYAYSSHSQAVLDCLRNRNEWARLVDRGPKTCVGRKRRKPDSDLPGTDSEDDSQDKTARTYRSKSIESSHEEFPKGRRKARKWSFKGRVTSRSKRRLMEFSGDEADSYLNSSEDASVSEDEIQGGVTPLDGAKISKSSDGIESM